MSYNHTKSSTKDAGATILIVDDEPLICEFVKWVLMDAGYRTRIAHSGPSAIRAVEQIGYPDLLLTDLTMPQMQGDELAATLRRGRPALKVLYLTGMSRELFRDRDTLDVGEALIEKPCSARQILEGVSVLLSETRVDSTVAQSQRVGAVRLSQPPDV
jgi:two-component system cell cycle sensor histidine kinase/response regulator CckA